jgi:hypothetical protein
MAVAHAEREGVSPGRSEGRGDAGLQFSLVMSLRLGVYLSIDGCPS